MTWKMSIDASGLDGLHAAIDAKLSGMIQQAVDQLAKEAAERARRARFQDRSGVTRQSIEGGLSEGETTDKQIVGILKAGGAAIFIDGGTVAHEILPKSKGRDKQGRFSGGRGRLRFETAGGDIVFARKVHHPGTRANPFITEAMSQNEFSVRITQAFSVAMGNLIREVNSHE